MNPPPAKPQFPPPVLFWPIQGTIWAFAILAGMFLALNWHFDPAPAFFFATLRASTGFLATSFLFRPLIHRLMNRGISGVSITVYLFAFAAIVSALDGLISIRLAEQLGVAVVRDYFPGLSALLRWPLYGTWALLYWLVCEWQTSRATALRLAQTEAAMVRTELDLLRAQVDPHFLFNVLNTILAVADKPEAVTTMTMALSDHLQFSLRRPNNRNTLASELTAVKNYLQLEKYRFEDDLAYRVDVADELLSSRVPFGTLLFPVENAVKYGQRTSPRPLRIEISARRDERTIRLEVRNTGAWVIGSDESGLGIGLANLRKTVGYFEGAISILRDSPECGWVTVAISFPVPQDALHAGRSA